VAGTDVCVAKPPNFGRTFARISTRGQIISTTLLLAPNADFQTYLRTWLGVIKVDAFFETEEDSLMKIKSSPNSHQKSY
jgi:hypothetical protein